MKYCSKCGKEIMDDAVICVHCGCQVAGATTLELNVQRQKKELSPDVAKYAFIFAFLMPLVGLILGIVGVTKYTDSNLKGKSVSAILISAGMWILCFFILSISMRMM
ncbi:MAG: zinc ribbon domain-containing protein [Clostridia bacterium]|nr:zinc ribbon domain-containing protein [Clostridia bacterium]